MLSRAAFGTVRSSAFLATFVVIFQVSDTLTPNALTRSVGHLRTAEHPLELRQRAAAVAEPHDRAQKRLLADGCVAGSADRRLIVAGFSTCLSLFIEDKKRRGELARAFQILVRR